MEGLVVAAVVAWFVAALVDGLATVAGTEVAEAVGAVGVPIDDAATVVAPMARGSLVAEGLAPTLVVSVTCAVPATSTAGGELDPSIPGGRFG